MMMTAKILKKIFPVLAVLLLLLQPVAYASDSAAARTPPIQVVAAESSAKPVLGVYGNAIGGVTTPGDLFYIDAAGSPVDIPVTLYLTNANELIHQYRYLTLRVVVYSQSDDNLWQGSAGSNDNLIPETYLTMRNGSVSFTLPGSARYKVGIDSGCFYCYEIPAGNDGISPRFYLTVAG